MWDTSVAVGYPFRFGRTVVGTFIPLDDFAHPKSFKHNTVGNGFIIGAGLNYVLNQYWALNANFDYQDWSTDNGTSKVFFADGTTAKTQLNEVNWTSYALMVGLSLRF